MARQTSLRRDSAGQPARAPQGKIRVLVAAAAAKGTASNRVLTWAHNLLSRAEYILYTAELLLVLPERGALCK